MNDRLAFLYDGGAEKALLGAMLISSSAIEVASRALIGSDFYSPAHTTIFDTCVDMWLIGQPVDAKLVWGELNESEKSAIGGEPTLITLISAAALSSNLSGYIDRIKEHANRRSIFRAASDTISQLEVGVTAVQASDALSESLTKVELVSGGRELSTESFEDLVNSPADALPGWVIPGMLRRRNRMMITAPTKTGKMTMIRQIAFCASRGVHPFTRSPMEPCKVLMLDLENPRETYTDPVMKVLLKRLDYMQSLDGNAPPEGGLQIVMREQGLDLRARSDRLLLEDLLHRMRPDILCICPIYKSFRKDSRMSSEELVEEVVTILDGLRTRYDCALLMEHHSARGSSDLFPFGSSVWERWVDFGRTMKRPDDSAKFVEWGSFCTADRMPVTWPEGFNWGTHGFPFEPVWPPGTHLSTSS